MLQECAYSFSSQSVSGYTLSEVARNYNPPSPLNYGFSPPYSPISEGGGETILNLAFSFFFFFVMSHCSL